jgi:hypothetical protein
MRSQRWRACRRVLVWAAALAVPTGGILALVMASSAGGATRAIAAGTHNPHVVTMAPARTLPAAAPRRSTAPASVSAKPADPLPPSARQAQQVQLAPRQLPAFTAEKWQPVGSPATRVVSGHDIGENECAKVDGAITWTQQGFSGGDGQNVAIQDTFVFTSASAAQTAYQHVVTGMDRCQQTTRALQAASKTPADATVTVTASAAHAEAWQRRWTGVMGISAGGRQTNHFYVAVNGTRLVVLQFTEFPGQATPYNVAADPQVLAMLDAELAR